MKPTELQKLAERLQRQLQNGELPLRETLLAEIALLCESVSSLAAHEQRLADHLVEVAGILRHTVALGLELTSLTHVNDARKSQIRADLGELQAYAENLT